MFDSLSEAQREALVAIGRATEAELWREIRPFVRRDQQEIASRGVLVDRLAAGRCPGRAAQGGRTGRPALGRRHGRGGPTVLADYRRAIGF